MTTLWIPQGDLPWINANHRLHHHKKAALTRDWRAHAYHQAITQDAPVCQGKVWIEAFIHRDRDGKYDPQNWYPTAKAIVDGLVDAGLLEDDDYTRVEGPFCRHGGKSTTPGIRITIRSTE